MRHEMMMAAIALFASPAARAQGADASGLHYSDLGSRNFACNLRDPCLAHHSVYLSSVAALRKDALATQAADGGRLSAAHQAVFQARLDALNGDYVHWLRNHRLMNADGTPVR